MNFIQYLKTKYSCATAMDDGSHVRRHANGSPCHAKSPDSCPENRKNAKMDASDDVDPSDESGDCSVDGLLGENGSMRPDADMGKLKDAYAARVMKSISDDDDAATRMELEGIARGTDFWIEDGDDGKTLVGSFSVSNPFGQVDYELGSGRGYRDVWEDEAEIADYRDRMSETAEDLIDDLGLDLDGYDYGEWESEDDGRGDSRFVYTFRGRLPRS